LYYLQTTLDSRDAFVVAVRSAFEKADVPLVVPPPGVRASENEIVRLVLQVDRVTVSASVPIAGTADCTEFLEENPDMLEIAIRDFLVRQRKRAR
jgi:hypothetical protein